MNPVKAFLDSNPSETIFMSIKPEHGSLDSGRLARNFIWNHRYKFYKSTVSPSTTLRSVRGKIVLFKRGTVSSVGAGLTWTEDGTHMKIQDEHALEPECEMINIVGKLIRKK